ncbi:HpcH/HpaI aldolase/citrate lyase family protein [Natrialbaceae archaeon A-arb3/5]
MVRRSVLFTPGDRPEMLRTASEAGADSVVFDLEDAVAPSQKDRAREAVRSLVTDPDFDPDCEVCVRVTAASDALDADLDALFGSTDTEPRLDSVVLPTVDSAEAVRTLVGKLEAYDVRYPILALIETARGVLAAPEIAAVSEIDALVFGAEDLAADLGATRTADGLEVLYARERVVTAAAAYDCDAIDTLVTDYEDESRLVEETKFAIRLGYDGKLAIHPAQIDPINDAFRPSAAELKWAEKVLTAKREADTDERGVFEVDGEMIDAPLIEQAKRLHDRAADRTD